MRRLYLVVGFIIIGGSVSVSAQPEPEIPSLSADQVDRLDRGDVLVDVATRGEYGVGDTIAVMNATPERVMTVIDGLDAELIEIVERTPEQDVLRGVTLLPWPMEDRVWMVIATTAWRYVDGVRVIISDWRYIPGSGNLDNTEGYWLLMPWGDDGQHTLLRHFIVAGIGTPVPNFIINWAMENQLPDTIDEIRRTLLSLGDEDVHDYRDTTAARTGASAESPGVRPAQSE